MTDGKGQHARQTAAGAKPGHNAHTEKETYIRDLFDSIAGNYDLMNMVMSLGMLRYWQRVFRRQTGLQSGQRALDVACGTGELAVLMAEQVGRAGRVDGIDLAPKMVEVGRRKVERMGLADRVSLQVGNALDMPFADDSFDCVATSFAMRNVADIEAAFREMVRVARPGGRVVCLELSRPPNPLLRAAHLLYVNKIVPWLGRWNERRFAARHHGQLPPYSWLPASLRDFPDQEGLAEIYRQAGMVDVHYRNLTGGAVCLHIGTAAPS